MRQIVISALLVFLTSVSSVCAQSSQRFLESKITVEEWQQYLKEVRAMPNAKIQEGRVQTLISIEAPDKSEAYYFTNENHPAHPAVIKISAFMDKGETVARVNGNYAGSKADFDPWFRWALGLVRQGGAK